MMAHKKLRKFPAHRPANHRPPTPLEPLEPRLLFAVQTGPELWFYNQTNLAVAANVTATKALIDRASAAGYSYMMLADTKLGYDGTLRPNAQNPVWNPAWTYYTNIASVISYGASKGIKVVPSSFDLGRAENWLLTAVDQNQAEGQQVIGANFTVAPNGQSLIFNPQNPTLTNTSFASGSTGWALDAPRATIDATTGRTDTSSLKINAGGGRGWAIQTIAVQPNRQYHVSYWVKLEPGFSGEYMIKLYDAAAAKYVESHEGDSSLTYNTATGGWQQKHYVFNSASSTQIQFRVGTWGSTAGTARFDDVAVEEIALHNVVRNPSSPLRIYRANNTTLVEGTDFNQIQEPYTAGVTGMTFRTYKTPLTVTIPAGSSLLPGQQVKIDYDAAQPVYEGQYAASMTSAGVKTYYTNNFTEIRKMFSNGTAVMLGGYDEIRSGNSSTGDKLLGKTAGQLLADSFKSTYDIIRAIDPTAPIYTWSDMFDPNHNAVNNFYLWNGNLAGSWLGVPSDVTIMNWNLGKLNASLKHFSALGNQQIIAGYYGAADGFATAQNEIAQAVGVPGVRGLMFTVWNGNYSELEDYAAGAKAAWAQLKGPTVESVHVRGAAWSTDYLNALAAAGKGDATLGYKIPVGSSQQLRTLPWGNVNQISITFSEAVTISQSALKIAGVNTALYGISNFTYNAATRTATWTLTTPITNDALRLTLPGTSAAGATPVTDLVGNPLDGEWTDTLTTTSGNGLSSGDFLFRFKILPGDLTADGTVNFNDFVILSQNFGATGASPANLLGAPTVGFPDFVVFSQNFGQLATPIPTPFTASSAIATPLTTARTEPVIETTTATTKPTKKKPAVSPSTAWWQRAKRRWTWLQSHQETAANEHPNPTIKPV